MADTWFSRIESTIFTHLQYVLTEAMDAPFRELTCTTSSQTESLDNVSVFPTLYIHLLPPVELGNDLTNISVNALNCTFEFEVFSDQSEQECNIIMSRCIEEMKALHFNVPMFPDPQSMNKKYFAIARFNRIIASGDLDIVSL